jgi:hypothetical protein
MDKRTRETIERLEKKLFQYQRILNASPHEIARRLWADQDLPELLVKKEMAEIVKEILDYLRRTIEQSQDG